jgi:probable HAF family extracellular repeat protein
VEAFLFRGATETLLGNLGSSGSYATSLNDLGDVVGLSNSLAYRAFLWREGSIYDLNSCILTNSGWVLVDADGINNAGQIVGHGMVGGSHRAFLLEPIPASGQGLTLVLEPTASPNLWRVKLARRPAGSVNFEISADLIKWLRATPPSAPGFFEHFSHLDTDAQVIPAQNLFSLFFKDV